jgi:hypothetical protein
MMIQIAQSSKIIDIKDTVRFRESLDQVMAGHPILAMPFNS